MRRVASLESERNRRNQDAILRLLDEMSSLADGDLTVQATVTDDITGAIADSINYAIEALRELVATINDTAMQLDQAARQTQAAAGHLAKASVAAVAPGGGGDRRCRRDGRRRSRKSRAMPSARPTSRATRSTSRTRAVPRCGARSTA
jgi:hypothetical protein